MGDTSRSLDVVLDSATLDQLNNAEARALIDTIDGLRELQIGEIVDLPQIVVVGDQSTGKSSVLEAISRVRFPAKSGLCTRYATELVLRKGIQANLTVKIQFAAGEQQKPWRKTCVDRDALPELVREAEEKMGFRGGSPKDFSRDVLRVEITSPDVYPLTLVDLPGFYHTETERQTLQGMEIVNQLAESYLKKKNSIILAVVAANYEFANQIVLREAKKHDPTRKRTLGVITKPDLAEPGSSNEKDSFQLLKGQENEHKLTLGWHVLRNRSQGEETSTADDRDIHEAAFFRSSAWAAIPVAQRGAENLRKKLSKVLLEHIQKNLPGLITEIETSLRTRQDELEQLGKSRSKPEDLKSYLLDTTADFQRLARDAVDGKYNDRFFGDIDEDEKKLRAQLRNLNRAFAVTLSTKGASYEIQWKDGDGDNSSDGNDEGRKFLQPFMDMYKFPNPEPISEYDLIEKLELLASVNQGKEFPGSPKADLVVQLFKMQAEPWQEIASFHLDLVTNFTKSFVERLFSHVIGTDKKTFAAILGEVVDPFFDEKSDALKAKLEELLRPYTAGFGLPLETEFRTRLSKKVVGRLADRLAPLLKGAGPETVGFSPKEITRMIENAEEFNSDELGIEKVIDMMDAYYDMSLRTFTDNVINLAVENCLVCGIPDILTPQKVHRMSEERLRELAEESEELQSQRNTLQKEVEVLRKGLRKCRQHQPRQLTSLPSDFQGLTPGRRSASRGKTPSPGPPTPTPSSSAHPTSILATTATTNTTTSAATRSTLFPTPPAATATTTATSTFVPRLFPTSPSQFPANSSSSNNTTSDRTVPSIFNNVSGGGLFSTPPKFSTTTNGTSKESGGGLFSTPSKFSTTTSGTSKESGGGSFSTTTNGAPKETGGGLFSTTTNGTPKETGGGLFSTPSKFSSTTDGTSKEPRGGLFNPPSKFSKTDGTSK